MACTRHKLFGCYVCLFAGAVGDSAWAGIVCILRRPGLSYAVASYWLVCLGRCVVDVDDPFGRIQQAQFRIHSRYRFDHVIRCQARADAAHGDLLGL